MVAESFVAADPHLFEVVRDDVDNHGPRADRFTSTKE